MNRNSIKQGNVVTCRECVFAEVDPIDLPCCKCENGELGIHKADAPDEGSHFDSNKVRLDLVPEEFVWGAGRGLTYGAFKYGENNFKKGIKWSKLIGSAKRHLGRFCGREEIDAESGLLHIDLLLSSLAMLRWMVANRPDLDDRHEIPVNPEFFEIPEELIEKWRAAHEN